MRKYIADFKWEEAKLAEIEVTKETKKSFMIDTHIQNEIIGRIYYLPNRLDKTKYHVFDDMKSALEWLSDRISDYIADKEKNLQAVRVKANMIADLIKQCE